MPTSAPTHCFNPETRADVGIGPYGRGAHPRAARGMLMGQFSVVSSGSISLTFRMGIMEEPSPVRTVGSSPFQLWA